MNLVMSLTKTKGRKNMFLRWAGIDIQGCIYAFLSKRTLVLPLWFCRQSVAQACGL